MENMKISRLYKLRSIFPRAVKIKLILLFLGIILGAQIETLTIAAVQPFILVLTDNTIVYENALINFIYRTLGFGRITGFLAFLSCGIAAIYAFRGLWVYFFNKIQNRFLATETALLSNRLLMQTLKQPYLYHVSNNVVQTQRVVIKNSERLFNFIAAVTGLMVDGFMSIFMLSFLLLTSYSMTLVVLFFATICIVVYFRIFKTRIKNTGEDEAKGQVMINKSVLQALGGVREIKISQKESFFTDKFKAISHATIKTRQQIQSLRQLPKLFIESLCFSGAFVVLAVVILIGTDMETLVPILGIFMLAAFKLLPAISRLVNSITQIIRLTPSIDQVYGGLFEQDSTYATITEDIQTDIPCASDIEMAHITFKYPKARKPVLKKVSFTIPHNSSVGFVGPSGAGKSTLIDILLGILPPQDGYVWHKGKSIHHHFKEWAQYVGYIPQVIYLLDETIMENVAFGIEKNKIDHDKVWSALRQAQMADYVESLEDGLLTQVGERGVRLSGGQRQRIGIARALYNNPSILVLDEATSSLDNDTETAVMEAIRNLQGSKTMIIVAHRLSTIEHCDIVYKVDKRTVTQVKPKPHMSLTPDTTRRSR